VINYGVGVFCRRGSFLCVQGLGGHDLGQRGRGREGPEGRARSGQALSAVSIVRRRAASSAAERRQ
jgi:hypothetical protein